MDYNDWIIDCLEKVDRKRVEIIYSLHAANQISANFMLRDKIEETIRTGRLHLLKCEPPNKLCFRRYYGKENLTYSIVANFNPEFIEVITLWEDEGN